MFFFLYSETGPPNSLALGAISRGKPRDHPSSHSRLFPPSIKHRAFGPPLFRFSFTRSGKRPLDRSLSFVRPNGRADPTISYFIDRSIGEKIRGEPRTLGRDNKRHATFARHAFVTLPGVHSHRSAHRDPPKCLEYFPIL